MPKPSVVMYGLTSEAYKLAADVVDKARVTVVDETLQMATELDAHFLRKNPNLADVMSAEPLLGFKPLERVLGEAQVVFFTPRLRRPADETLMEAGAKLRELSRYLSKGTALVNALPTGPGGNSENIMLVEKQTGLRVGDTLTYAYLPLRPQEQKPALVSVAGKGEGKQLLSGLGFTETSQNVFAGELEYAASVLESVMGSVTEIEMARRAREAKVSLQKPAEAYIDSFAKYLYELKAIQGSDETGESISYLAGAALKSLENYVRYAVDETREVLKEKELKASRTKIGLVWSLDQYEMRGERLQLAESLQQRLRDYVTDVELIPGSKIRGGSDVLDPLKHNLLIACSKDDCESVRQARKARRSMDMTLLLATAGLRRD